MQKIINNFVRNNLGTAIKLPLKLSWILCINQLNLNRNWIFGDFSLWQIARFYKELALTCTECFVLGYSWQIFDTFEAHYYTYSSYSVCMSICLCLPVCGLVSGGSKLGLWELVISFHHMGSKNETQVVRLSGKCDYTLSYL